jgi:hypothetical protein
MPGYCRPTVKPDRMIYFVLCRYLDGLAWAERDLGRTNRKDTLEDILSGELPRVEQVIELNYVEFTSRDVTEDFLIEFRRNPPCLSPSERLAAMADHARDHRKNWVA